MNRWKLWHKDLFQNAGKGDPGKKNGLGVSTLLSCHGYLGGYAHTNTPTSLLTPSTIMEAQTIHGTGIVTCIRPHCCLFLQLRASSLWRVSPTRLAWKRSPTHCRIGPGVHWKGKPKKLGSPGRKARRGRGNELAGD